MSASYYLTAKFNKCAPRRQLGSCSVTRPLIPLSAKGVACETNCLLPWLQRANNRSSCEGCIGVEHITNHFSVVDV